MIINNIDFNTVFNEFINEQSVLLVTDANEQAISHQLAAKLINLFPDWTVDCEYNRDGYKVKQLIYAVSPDGTAKERNVVPDVIVHHRLTENNLLAIEVKKSTNPEESFKDLAKLNAFKDQLGYQYALFIRFKTGSEDFGIEELEWV